MTTDTATVKYFSSGSTITSSAQNASAKINEFLTMYFLKNPVKSIGDLSAWENDVGSKTRNTGIYYGDEGKGEVSYDALSILVLKDATAEDYFLLSGDPAIIFTMGMVVGDINNGKANVLKWDRQEKTYYPLNINIFQK